MKLKTYDDLFKEQFLEPPLNGAVLIELPPDATRLQEELSNLAVENQALRDARTESFEQIETLRKQLEAAKALNDELRKQWASSETTLQNMIVRLFHVAAGENRD